MVLDGSAGARPHALRRLWWIALDYLYAGWRQVAVALPPWSIRRVDDVPWRWREGSAGLPEVLLLPGVYEHWRFLRPLGDALSDAGYRVGVGRGLGINLRDVAATSDRLLAALSAMPAPPNGRMVVAHSKGGLIGKHLLLAADPPIQGMVAVATPFLGSRRARLLRSRSMRAFLPTDETIVWLTSSTTVNARIVSVFGPYDHHIPEGSFLEGATNVQVPTPGHFRVLGARSTHEAVVRGLVQLTGEASASA